MSQKLWIIQLLDNNFEIEFEINEYEVVECKEQYLYIRRDKDSKSFSVLLKKEEIVDVCTLPITYTRDYAHIELMKAKICLAVAEYHRQHITKLETDIKEDKRLMEAFEYYGKAHYGKNMAN